MSVFSPFSRRFLKSYVTDMCPSTGCKTGDIDSSREDFAKLANPNLGRIQVSWAIRNCESQSTPNTTPKPPNTIGKRLWEFCEKGSECTSKCCTKRRSNDQQLKCHESNDCTIQNQTSSSLLSPGDKDTWEYCTNDSQCKSMCCSKLRSNDDQYKCHESFDCKPNQSSILHINNKEMWVYCLNHAECKTKCCSKLRSSDNEFKCHAYSDCPLETKTTEKL